MKDLNDLKTTLDEIDKAVKHAMKLTSNFITTKLAIKAECARNKDADSTVKYKLNGEDHIEAAWAIANEYNRPTGNDMFVLIEEGDGILRYALMSNFELLDYCQDEQSDRVMACSIIDRLISDQDLQAAEAGNIDSIIDHISALIKRIHQ